MTKFILTSPTGKLGSRVFIAIIKQSLISPADIILTTSSAKPTSRATPESLQLASQQGIPIRYGLSFNQSPEDIAPSFKDGDVLFLSSYPSPSIERWNYHRHAIDAAILAGVRCIVYTSLMFGGEDGRKSVAGVQQAHIKTIEYLEQVRHKVRGGGKDFEFIVVREGIYAESWWLYCGYQSQRLGRDQLNKDGELDFVVPNDGKVAWVTLDDLSVGTARIVADYQQYLGQTLRLTGQRTTSLSDIARMVNDITGWKVKLKEVGKEEAECYHKERKSAGEGADWVIESWVGWFDGLKDGECEVVDPLLGNLIGREVKGIEELKGQLFKAEG
jgi:NAD(P)H dehydrogenase (quinone)